MERVMQCSVKCGADANECATFTIRAINGTALSTISLNNVRAGSG